ncbi:hypothetical protein JAO76_13710 [Pontibacter sp. BT310]|uniref:TerB family tellurite resistance protein n=1 Tax=Pontibacter populi TaxID=890055 RepID=A0ABS6XDR8_9BACT|nr:MULTISPECIES: hypothetical protein [Pontibacter]MBJ6119261.1 hypothetical protein [Pontibacter sp. BT310]MBR0571689.1 hypothetical protein [Microvirga sp. STS03]MBW3366115.1 hypothetical protein [Pontibacter populi]
MATGTSIDNLLNTKQKKLSFFQNLILVATADGFVDSLESDFLVMIGDQLGLTEEDTSPIADNLPTLSFIVPEEGMQKTVELQTLVMMVLQDGKVEDKEYQLCLDYTRRIGYSKDMLDGLISDLSKNPA